MPTVLANKRLLGVVAAFIFLTFLLAVSLPSTTNITYRKPWSSTVSQQQEQSEVQVSKAQENKTEDEDFVFPTYEYTYETIAQMAADKKESRDPCQGVPVPDGGRLIQKGDGIKVLVTGGAGFIGSNLVDRLLLEGYQVNILDNLYTGFIRNVPLDHPNVNFFLGDILNPETIRKAMEGVEYVYHLAAMSKVVPSLKSSAMARFCTESNALGSWNVLEIARQSVIKKVIYAASSTYYGNHPAPHQEDMPPDFLTPYAASKYEGEIQMQMFDTLFGVPTISTRFFMVYGPRQPSTGAYAIVTGVFAKQAADGKPLTIEGDGTHYRDFIHVSDIVEGLMIAQQTEDLHGDVVNLGSGTSFSVQDVADLVSADQVYVDPRKNDLEGTLADTCKQKRVLGHVAKKDFKTEMSYMVKETMAGNVFMQSWLREGHALAAPHITAPSSPFLGWPEDHSDLESLLLALQHLQERFDNRDGTQREETILSSRRLSIIFFDTIPGDEEDNQTPLLMNTVYSLVRFGEVKQYLVAAGDELALRKCIALNMPCFDSRPLPIPLLLAYLVNRNYDVHLAQIGNSYISSVEAAYNKLSQIHKGADILGASPSGDVFIVANDRTRSISSQWAQSGVGAGSMSSTFKVHSLSDWPEMRLTKVEYPVERYCQNRWVTHSEHLIIPSSSPSSSSPSNLPSSSSSSLNEPWDDEGLVPATELSEGTGSYDSSPNPSPVSSAVTIPVTGNVDAHKTQKENEASEVKEAHSNNNQPGDKPFGEADAWGEDLTVDEGNNPFDKRESFRPVSQGACETRFYSSIGCGDEYIPAYRDLNSTITILKHVQAWHYTHCMDPEHCDLQQIVPKYWVQHGVPDLAEFGGYC